MTDRPRWGLTVPLAGVSLADHQELLREAETIGYTDFWSSEVNALDAFTPLVLAANWTQEARLGTAIASVFTRGPAVLAMHAAAIQEAAPGRFVLGLGAASDVIVEQWNGIPFKKPLTRVREVHEIVREALNGGAATLEGETITVRNFKLTRPFNAPVPIYLAALREKMLALAGATSEGVIINWLAASDVPKVAAVAKQAARAAGRDPDALDVACRIFVCLTDDVQTARAQARRHIAAYLTVPVYDRFHQWLGRGEILRPMTEAWRSGDRRGAVAAIPEHVLDELIIMGDAETCRRGVQAYGEQGVTTPIVNFLPLAADPDGQAREVVAALRALTPPK